MPQIGSMTIAKLTNILAADDGMPATLAAMSSQEGVELPGLSAEQIVPQNVGHELWSRGSTTKYPLVYVYCTKIVNQLKEKFRTFSGEAQMAVEVRVSQDRLDDIESRLHSYVDAVVQVLDASRGDWGDGVFYDGEYEVAFSGVKQGGNNFIQSAKVSIVLGVSRD